MEAADTARDDNLKKANRIRIARAQLKRELKAGRDPVRIVNRPPKAAVGMSVYDFLQAVPKIGRKRANRILLGARMSPNRTLGNLTAGERKALVRGLEGQEVRVWKTPQGEGEEGK